MIRSLAALAFVLAGALPASAQQSAPAADELLALNFYVQQQDTKAVEAELLRLQLKYPQWTPPQDLSRIGVTAPSAEIDAFYRQVAEGRFDQARETLAKARQDYPDWNPPAEMPDLLEIAEGQVLLDAALEEENLANALQIAGNVPGLLRCDRINNAWRLAEAQQAGGSDGDALGTYRAVLTACINEPDLVATLEKADEVASETELRSLFAQVMSRFPEQEERYSEVLQRLLAGRGSGEPSVTSDSTGAERPVPRSATAPRSTARPAPEAPAAAAQATASQPPRTTSSRAQQPGASSVDALAAAGDWSGCMQRSAGSTVATVIYQRGWCAFNLERPMEAISAFRTALAGRLDPTQRRDAAFGMALAYLKMNMPEEAARISAGTDFTRSQRVDIERQILDQRGVLAYRNKQYKQAIQYFDALEQVAGGIRRDLAILRAYAYLNSGNQSRARAEFLRLNNEISTRESRAGLSAASGG
ncbi:tetratricopeptide repeat protein [Paracoccus sp. Z118]|uniref:tetratricopeptide repeat protein n=1 Tax=Paracoccus sp. Z118 TaxID=2851017 RepID=UPI001C2C9677|nr:tetratricopeptide repeat protein [Paracoccus sp. Z118]MBV0892867.1 tetratricopeptide repeat protein [Paracoccus sp. Z118]